MEPLISDYNCGRLFYTINSGSTERNPPLIFDAFVYTTKKFFRLKQRPPTWLRIGNPRASI